MGGSAQEREGAKEQVDLQAVEQVSWMVAKEQAGVRAKEQASFGTCGAVDGFKLDVVGSPDLLSTDASSGCSSLLVGRP